MINSKLPKLADQLIVQHLGDRSSDKEEIINFSDLSPENNPYTPSYKDLLDRLKLTYEATKKLTEDKVNERQKHQSK